MKSLALSLLVMLPLPLAAAPTPVSVPLAELLRDQEYVVASNVGTNALLRIFFWAWPGSQRETELSEALRSHSLVQITDGTNTIVRGTLLGNAFGEDREGHNVFGLLLRLDSLKAAKQAEELIEYDPDTQIEREIERMRSSQTYKVRLSLGTSVG